MVFSEAAFIVQKEVANFDAMTENMLRVRPYGPKSSRVIAFTLNRNKWDMTEAGRNYYAVHHRNELRDLVDQFDLSLSPNPLTKKYAEFFEFEKFFRLAVCL